MSSGKGLRSFLEGLKLEAAVVKDVLACFTMRSVRKNAVFARAGEVDARLGFVVEGLFAMETVHEDGRLFIKDFLVEGSFLLGSFRPDQENLVTFRALRNSLVLEAPYGEVQSLYKRHPVFGALAHQGLERRYEALCDRLERLAGLDATSRYKIFRKDFQAVEKDIPLNLVAAYLNITPTQLSRIRRKEIFQS